MGFWHTGYMEFHEPTSERYGSHAAYIPPPPEFPCEHCGVIFRTLDDLNAHRFDGHPSHRARLFLRGRECGRSRTSVVAATAPEDWAFDNAIGINVNDVEVDERTARKLLCSSKGVVKVRLRGGHLDQDFEFSFEMADGADLDAVDLALSDLIGERTLSLTTIQRFLDRCQRLKTSSSYSDGLANYFYGVLARERSPESSLWQTSQGLASYRSRFDDAVSRLGALDRAPAEAVCGLVAFHYNHFDIAMRKTRSPRVARVSSRLASIVAGKGTEETQGLLVGLEDNSIDRALSDVETERVVNWCAVPLDGSAQRAIAEIEDAIAAVDPLDQLKLHLIAGEHYLAAGHVHAALRHADELRHTAAASSWQSSVRQRANRDA